MASITIRKVPKDLYERLKRAAAAHRRSINSEVIVSLERVLEPAGDPDEFLARADALRERLALPPLTARVLREAKAAGRP